MISRYLEEKDFVGKVYFNENDRLEIFLSKPIDRPSIGNLAYVIQTLFDFKGPISFFKPSKTEGYYIMFATY
jgi:hypothetical protein